MRSRGRVSAAESAVVIPGGFAKRPQPPSDLNERQRAIWRETAASEEPKFFETAVLRALLSDYCRHRDAAEKVSEVIDTFKPEWLKSAEGAKRYHGLLKMRDLETRAAAGIATKLRLTNQARYTPQAAATASKHAAKATPPWEM